MKPYVVDWGLTYCQVSFIQVHISAPLDVANCVLTPPVKAG